MPNSTYVAKPRRASKDAKKTGSADQLIEIAAVSALLVRALVDPSNGLRMSPQSQEVWDACSELLARLSAIGVKGIIHPDRS